MLRQHATGFLLHLLQLPVEQEREAASRRRERDGALGREIPPAAKADGEGRYSGRDVCGTTEML